ncbi:hypothetical protein [Jiangella sp. DSM 45060]|uniref:hypothetical protein n=1 Tax=Jiangella sp. DSM 45060 TaxID=1798224 RepID=UPI00087A9FE8|nr:hypothetical protein [Jiangella sp. DSM 45060]SDT23656.1 hypothetical protein SAMN04515669_3206 [Jiangella sp. DSM 45060]
MGSGLATLAAVDPVPWARGQLAFTLGFHIILVPLGVSWASGRHPRQRLRRRRQRLDERAGRLHARQRGNIVDVDPWKVIFNDAMPLQAAHLIIAALTAVQLVVGTRQVNIVHLSWEIMVGLGTLLFLLSVWYGIVWAIRRRMPQSRWFLRAAAASGVPYGPRAPAEREPAP